MVLSVLRLQANFTRAPVSSPPRCIDSSMPSLLLLLRCLVLSSFCCTHWGIAVLSGHAGETYCVGVGRACACGVISVTMTMAAPADVVPAVVLSYVFAAAAAATATRVCASPTLLDTTPTTRYCVFLLLFICLLLFTSSLLPCFSFIVYCFSSSA